MSSPRSCALAGVLFTAFAVEAGAGITVDLARAGTASQSSTRNGAPKGNLAILAVDGNTNGAFGGLSVTHTNTQTDPWWRVDLGQVRTVDSVVLWDRTDGCCVNRILGYNVQVLDAAMTPVSTITPGDNPNPSSTVSFGGVDGQYVQVNLPGGGKILSLAEVQVFGEVPHDDPVFFGQGINLARLGSASQSSTRSGSPTQGDVAQVAVDGNTDGVFNNGSVTHTTGGGPHWWEVDLGDDFYDLDSIVIWNRAEVPNRLTNFRVSVTNGGVTSFQQDYFTSGGFPNPSLTIPLASPALFGDTVRVEFLAGGGTLSLAEVQVFGTVIPEPSRALLLAVGMLGLFARRRRG